jgi:hypothetical protein
MSYNRLKMAPYRTSSLSLHHALQILGFNPYHMVVLLKNGKREIDFLTEAIEAHYSGKGKRFGRKEFDKWLGPYDVGLLLSTHDRLG